MSSIEMTSPRDDFYQDNMATAPLRFLHLYQDLIVSGKLKDPHLKVMTLGLGCLLSRCEGSEEVPIFPQKYELLALLEGDKQSLDCYDYNPDLIALAEETLYYDPSCLEHFFKTMELAEGVEGKWVEGFVEYMKERVDLSKRLILPEIRNILWNPQDPEDAPPEIDTRYDVIIATCSALFHRYIEEEKIFPTWLRILNMLQKGGTLYVDSCSFRVIRRQEDMLPRLERATESTFSYRKIRPIIDLSSELEITCEVMRARIERTRYPILYFGAGPDASLSHLASSSYSVYAIQKS